GPTPHTEHLGGLLLAQLEEVAAGEHVAVPFVEAVHGLEQLTPPLLAEGESLRRRDRVSGGHLGGLAQCQCLATLRRPPPVVRLVRHDAQEPWPELGTRTEARQRLPRLHESDLRRLFRVGSRAREQI